MSSQKPSPDWQKFLPVLLIAFAGLLLYFGLSGSSSEPQTVQHDPKLQTKVNEHLRQTAEKMEMAKRQQALRSQQLVKEFNASVAETAYTAPSEGVDLQETDHSHEVAKDLGKTEESLRLGGSNASDLIHQQMFESQMAQQQDEAYRKEYARQFIENARRGGWDVKLDENYRVKSVKKIRHANQFDLFQ